MKLRLVLIQLLALCVRAQYQCKVYPPSASKTYNLVKPGESITVSFTDQYNYFEVYGDECLGSERLKYTQFASYKNGTRLSKNYLSNVDTSSPKNLTIKLSPQTDDESTQSHAVYIQATDPGNKMATEWFCFMITDTGENFCQKYCQTQKIISKTLFPPNSIYYFIKPLGASEVVEITNEFAFESENPVVCPLSYSIRQVDSTLGQISGSIQYFDDTEATFYIQTDDTTLYDPVQTFETYEIQVTNSATENDQKLQFTIYYTSCQQEQIILDPTPTEITYSIFVNPNLSVEEITDTISDLGFQSSNPSNCPIFLDFDQTMVVGANLSIDQSQTGLQVYSQDETLAGSEHTFKVFAHMAHTDFVAERTITLKFQLCEEADQIKCASCSKGSFKPANLEASSADFVFQNSKGCSACKATYEPYLYESATTGNLIRGCRERGVKAQVDESCDFGSVVDKAGNCVACSSQIDECPLCLSSITCKMCEDPNLGVSFIPSGNKCTRDLCFGCSDCSVVPNCIYCSRKNPYQTCYLCAHGFYYDYVQNHCEHIMPGVEKYEFFVKAYEGVHMDEVEREATEYADGTLVAPFRFLQQAIDFIYRDGQYLYMQEVEITVYLTKGQHFMFSCFNELFKDYSLSIDINEMSVFCADFEHLAPIYPTSDNIKFHFKAMLCSLKSQIFFFFEEESQIFDELCIDDRRPYAKFTKPTINVLDSYTYFNVTRSMSFENIHFTGIHALAQTNDQRLPLSSIPVRKCIRKSEIPDGTHTKIKLTEDTSLLSQIQFTCDDQLFREASIPMQNFVPCDSSSFSQKLGDDTLKRCSGEPYHPDFFAKDQVSKMFYKRHRILFNLYNYDNLSSWNSSLAANLTLINCDFDYFLNDYESLINIENNNIVEVSLKGANMVYLMGEDKGVNLNIVGSTFSHSRFCKGMIVYRPAPDLQSDMLDIYKMQGFSLPSQLAQKPKIIVQKSTFENLNWGNLVTQLQIVGESMRSILLHGKDLQVPVFENFGIIINAQGFPGGIQFSENTFKRNMVFVNEIYPQLRSQADVFETIEKYLLEDRDAISLTRCESLTGEIKRFMSDFLTSLKPNPANELTKFEAYSPVYIAEHKWSVIFDQNNFEENIGIAGGAVSINTPDFNIGDHGSQFPEKPEDRPFTIFYKNRFTSNQAYFSGNAVHFRARRIKQTVNEMNEVCGGAFMMQQNEFRYNSPVLVTSNGGAVSIECDYVAKSITGKRIPASNQYSMKYDRAYWTGDLITRQQYKTFIYSAGFVQNIFEQNYVGQKGSAIYARDISNVVIQDNDFTLNQPLLVLTQETSRMPFYNLLAKKQRSISFYSQWTKAKNEFKYMDQYADTFENGGLIDLPQVQGAIYIENCMSCLISYEQVFDDCSFCFRLPQQVEISNNDFNDNQVGVAFFEEHDLQRASQIMLSGGKSNLLRQNKFFNITSIYGKLDTLRQFPSYWAHTPSDYFESTQAPLIRIFVPQGVSLLYKRDGEYAVANTIFEKNTFAANQIYQPFVKSQIFKGGLIDYEAETMHAGFVFNENGIEDNFVLGEDSSLIYIKGASIKASNNIFLRNGHLNTDYVPIWRENYVDVDALYFPYLLVELETRQWTMGKGMFWFIVGQMEGREFSKVPLVYTFENNIFEYAFCIESCIYNQEVPDRAMPTLINYSNNIYKDIFAEENAILHIKITEQTPNITLPFPTGYSIQNFTNEFVKRVQNGAFRGQASDHNLIFLMSNLTIENSFGNTNSSLIHLSDASFFACTFCNFSQTYDSLSDHVQIVAEEFESTILNHEQLFNVFRVNRQNFTSYLDLKTSQLLFNKTSLNQQGVLRVSNLKYDEQQINVTEITCNGSSIGKLMEPLFNFQPIDDIPKVIRVEGQWTKIIPKTPVQELWDKGVPSFLPHSLISNITWSGIKGIHAGLIRSEDSSLLMLNSKIMNSAVSATAASPIKLIRSNLTLDENVLFEGNQGEYGGAIYATDHSFINLQNTKFIRNVARRHGGVIMLDDESYMHGDNLSFEENRSWFSGAVIYASNIEQNQSLIQNSVFYKNFAEQNLIQLLNSKMKVLNCQFIDNKAQSGTHGFQIINSYLTADNVVINNSEQEFQSETSPVLAGFFYLMQTSNLQLLNNSLVQRTQGSIASAIYLQSGSSCYVQQTSFIDLKSPKTEHYNSTGVIVGQQSEQIFVDQVDFVNNDNTNIFSDRTPVVISNSKFQYGQGNSYVQVFGSSLRIYSSAMQNSSDIMNLGRGIFCYRCLNLEVQNCIFQNLGSLRGGAIYMAYTENAFLIRNTFSQNQAQQGGAVYILQAKAEVRDNLFVKNQGVAQNQTNNNNNQISIKHEGSGAAIFFTCVDVSDSQLLYNATAQSGVCSVNLQGNNFTSNYATNKGGALVWTNTNFTEIGRANVFENNVALLGDTISSPPHDINIELIPDRKSSVDQFFPPFEGPQTVKLDSFYSQVRASFVITSGQKFRMKVKLFDKEGLVYKDDSASTAQLIFYGDRPIFSSIKGNTAIANRGVFDFDEISIVLKPGTKAYMQLKIFNLNTYGNNLSFIEIAPKILLEARMCIIGEYYTPQFTCESCPVGFFSFTLQSSPGECEPCPTNAICPGENLLLPEAGHIRMHASSSVFIRCFNNNACLQGTEKSPLQNCAQGYTGIMCSTCEDGYWRESNQFKCYECILSPSFNIIYLIFKWLMLILFLIFLQKLYKRNYSKRKQESVTIIRIFINMMHFVYILSKTIDIDYTSKEANVFEYFLIYMLNFIDFVQNTLFDIQCMRAYFGVTFFTSNYTYFKIIFFSLLPLFLLGLFYLVMWFYKIVRQGCWCCRNKKVIYYDQIKLKNKITIVMCILVFMLQPTLVELLFTSVNCFDSLKSDEGSDVVQRRLRDSPDIECWNTKHTLFILLLVIPAILFWVFFVPIFGLYKISKKSQSVYLSQHLGKNENISNYAKLKYNEIKSRYGFFYSGYKQEVQKSGQKLDDLHYEKEMREQSGQNATFAEARAACFNKFLGPLSGYGVVVKVENFYVRSYFYWEFVIYMQKVILLAIILFWDNQKPGMQSIIILILCSIFAFMQLKNLPYESSRANFLSILSYILLMLIIFTRISLRNMGAMLPEFEEFNNTNNGDYAENTVINTLGEKLATVSRYYGISGQDKTWPMLLIGIIILIIIIILCVFFGYLYLHLLIYLLENRHTTVFRYLTLGVQDVALFKQTHIKKQDEEEEQSEEISSESQSNQMSDSVVNDAIFRKDNVNVFPQSNNVRTESIEDINVTVTVDGGGEVNELRRELDIKHMHTPSADTIGGFDTDRTLLRTGCKDPVGMNRAPPKLLNNQDQRLIDTDQIYLHQIQPEFPIETDDADNTTSRNRGRLPGHHSRSSIMSYSQIVTDRVDPDIIELDLSNKRKQEIRNLFLQDDEYSSDDHQGGTPKKPITVGKTRAQLLEQGQPHQPQTLSTFESVECENGGEQQTIARQEPLKGEEIHTKPILLRKKKKKTQRRIVGFVDDVHFPGENNDVNKKALHGFEAKNDVILEEERITQQPRLSKHEIRATINQLENSDDDVSIDIGQNQNKSLAKQEIDVHQRHNPELAESPFAQKRSSPINQLSQNKKGGEDMGLMSGFMLSAITSNPSKPKKRVRSKDRASKVQKSDRHLSEARSTTQKDSLFANQQDSNKKPSRRQIKSTERLEMSFTDLSKVRVDEEGSKVSSSEDGRQKQRNAKKQKKKANAYQVQDQDNNRKKSSRQDKH